MASTSDAADYDEEAANYFMQQALRVAKGALDIGEVPVGCVIVLRDGIAETKDTDASTIHDGNTNPPTGRDNNSEFNYQSSPSVIISHGANQVNATRDATRHAEVVAIDRMLSQARSSDQLKLPAEVIRKSAHGKIPDSYASGDDHWENVPDEKDHWKNGFGWGSGRSYDRKILERCDLYVTCEPCIMVRRNCLNYGFECIGRVLFLIAWI